MKIYPAIDIKEGKCVRLKQGDFDQVTVFNDEPANVAKDWQDAGASFIHVVDLDGARFGSGYNDETIRKILSAVTIPIQVGGGIRTMEDIERKLTMGVSRVILGTAAIKKPELVKEAVAKYGAKIAVGIDAVNGKVAIEGWEEISKVDSVVLCAEMAELGIKTIIYTDISKDGMMSGPNIEGTGEIIDITGIDIIVSGGVSSNKDLDDAVRINAHGAIIGKALYSGALNLKETINQYER